MPSNGNVMPYRCGTLMLSALASTFAQRLVGVVVPCSHDRRLARGAEQRAVLGPEVHEPVPEPVGEGMDADVGEHPLGGDAVRDAQRVVEAVAAGALAERLPDAERHEVADDRERRGRHLEQLGEPHPQRRVPRARRTGQLVRAHGRCDPLLEAVADRAPCAGAGGRGGSHASGGGTSGRIAHWPSTGSGRSPSAPSTVRTSVSPTCAMTRAWLIW